MNKSHLCFAAGFILSLVASIPQAFGQAEYQYKFENILIGPASADEPIAAEFSNKKAIKYLEQGATAWIGSRKCIACHTTGVHLVTRPALTTVFGPPRRPEVIRG